MIKSTYTIPRSLFSYLRRVNPFYFSTRQQFQLAADLIPFGVWEYDLFTGHLIFSKPLYRLFGIQKETFDHTLSGFKEVVHPEDRKNIEDIIHIAIHRPAETLKKYTYRIQLPDRNIRFIQGNIRLITDKKHQPIKLTGVCIDITSAKSAEIRLKKEYEKSDLYLTSVEAMIVVLNKDATIKLINKAGRKITGYSESDLLNRNWYDIFSPPDQRNVLKDTFSSIANGIANYPEYYERELITKDGSTKCIAWRNTLLRDEHNTITGILATGIDISDKKRAEQKLMEQNEQLRKIAWMQSHEVRKPLANIMGLLTLVDAKKLEESNKHIFQYLKQSSEELDLMIRDIIEKTKALNT